MQPNQQLLQLIQIGQTSDIYNNELFSQKLKEYLDGNPNEKLEYHIDSLNIWAKEKESRYFNPVKFKIMNELYELAELTPQKALNTLNPDKNNIYLNYLLEIALRQEPKKVKIENWSPSCCPTCGIELSEHRGDGYFVHPTYKDNCPNCLQALKW